MESNFKKLLENILLTERQEADARTKYNGVCETLHNYYYPNTTYDGRTKLLIGSFGKSTVIRPPRDVDVLFKMPMTEFERVNGLNGNKQSQLLQEIRNILKDTYTTTEEIRAFGKVVVIQFSDGAHSVELLPAWQLADGKFKIPDTENGGSWGIFDPISEMKNISDSNKKTGKTISMIRVCKKWEEYCNVEIKSFILEILVVNYLATLNDSALNESSSRLMTGFFKYLLNQSNTNLARPTGEIVALGDTWKSKTETASQRSQKALEYEVSEKFEDASNEWKKVFGDDFPKSEPVSKSSIVDTVNSLQKQYPSTTEQSLDVTYDIPFVINPAYKVKIDAMVTQDGFRTNWLSEFLRQKFNLKKSKKLRFSITENTVPSYFSVKWKVRNFGEEAKKAEGLRGEITDDFGSHTKEEHTKYYGEHYVECYIIKDNKCVAMDHILVPIGTEY